MFDELTDEEKSEFIKKLVEEIKKRYIHRFNFTKKKMDKSEMALVETFDENQRALYDNFCKQRKKFYKAANDIYVNMYASEFKD